MLQWKSLVPRVLGMIRESTLAVLLLASSMGCRAPGTSGSGHALPPHPADEAADGSVGQAGAVASEAPVALDALEDFGPCPGTSSELQEKLEVWCEQMFDPEAGPERNRARLHLIHAGRPAMPVIINALKKMDLTEQDQFMSADIAQYALGQICAGKNFGWKYPSQEPEAAHRFNRKVIRRWIQLWEKAEYDDAFWARLIGSSPTESR